MELLTQDIPLWLIALYVLFMAAANAMPKPDANDGKGYRFTYAFAQGLAVNLKDAKDSLRQNGAAK